MAYRLNEKLKNLVPYEPIAGEYEVRLDANESFINPGNLYKEEIIDAITKIPLNRYPDPTCKKLREVYGKVYNLNPENLVAGNGSDELLAIIIGAFIGEDEIILTLEPDFSMYGFYGDIYGRKMKSIKKEDLFKDIPSIVPEKLLAAIKDVGASALLFSNPGSPTSSVMARQDVIKIIEGTNKLVIVDEAYMEFSDESVLNLAGKYDNLIVLRTCSKAWGMAGIRLGFAASSAGITKALNSLRSPYNINSLTQEVACVILSHPEYLEKSVKDIKVERDKLYDELMELSNSGRLEGIDKSHTNFIYIKTEKSAKIFEKLKEHSIVVRKHGDTLRITTGNRVENERLIFALNDILQGKGMR